MFAPGVVTSLLRTFQKPSNRDASAGSVLFTFARVVSRFQNQMVLEWSEQGTQTQSILPSLRSKALGLFGRACRTNRNC